ncbi:Protein of unknown function [Cotesia congregata]|uniref:Uncharacterized protein n=1 Tax=Cotesia congregata TaxID=51543 RepID=A0A8J2MRE3_COTCN|nr:Protein of unknown function [Cotesia congregata]
MDWISSGVLLATRSMQAELSDSVGAILSRAVSTMNEFDPAEVPTDITPDNIYENVEAQLLCFIYEREYAVWLDEFPGKGTLYITTKMLVWIKEDKTGGFQFQISDMGYVRSNIAKEIFIKRIKNIEYAVMFLFENDKICDSVRKKIENAGINVDRK